MGEPASPQKSCDSSASWHLMHISWRLGFLQATCNQILAEVKDGRQKPPQTGSGQAPRLLRAWRRLHELWEHVERLQKLFTIMRAIRWGSLAWSVGGVLRWLGVI